MAFTKKKPYRHKGKPEYGKAPTGSDGNMVKRKKGGQSESDRYKDHIDGA